MTGKEAVLATMNQQPTDRPVVTLITGGEWYFNYANACRSQIFYPY
jgi:hypothetical protein